MPLGYSHPSTESFLKDHASLSAVIPCCPATTGNHPYSPRSTLNSPSRVSSTSTPSATNASRCLRAPSVPGPREDIAPEEPIIRCHGTGGFVPGCKNLSAFFAFSFDMFQKMGVFHYLDRRGASTEASRPVWQYGLQPSAQHNQNKNDDDRP